MIMQQPIHADLELEIVTHSKIQKLSEIITGTGLIDPSGYILLQAYFPESRRVEVKICQGDDEYVMSHLKAVLGEFKILRCC